MMFLSTLFAAFARLTASVNSMADLFDAANDDLRQRLHAADARQLAGPTDAPENNARANRKAVKP